MFQTEGRSIDHGGIGYCSFTKHRELVQSWNDYYPCPENKCRIGLSLANPKLIVDLPEALSHDFYYFTDEFSVIFDPLPINNANCKRMFLLVEGPHKDPTKGVRVPILGTWTNIRRLQLGERGVQHVFAFYDNRWWEVHETSYTYTRSDDLLATAYPPSEWCGCSPRLWGASVTTSLVEFDDKHRWYKYRSDQYTLFDNKETSQLFNMVSLIKKDHNAFYIINDWLEDHDDPFAFYMRDIKFGDKKNRYYLKELNHMCHFIASAGNDRAAKLLLLAYIINHGNTK